MAFGSDASVSVSERVRAAELIARLAEAEPDENERFLREAGEIADDELDEELDRLLESIRMPARVLAEAAKVKGVDAG